MPETKPVVSKIRPKYITFGFRRLTKPKELNGLWDLVEIDDTDGSVKTTLVSADMLTTCIAELRRYFMERNY